MIMKNNKESTIAIPEKLLSSEAHLASQFLSFPPELIKSQFIHTYLLLEAQSMVKHDLNNPKVQQNLMVLKEPTCLCVPDTWLNQMKHKAQVIKYYNIKPMHQIFEAQS